MHWNDRYYVILQNERSEIEYLLMIRTYRMKSRVIFVPRHQISDIVCSKQFQDILGLDISSLTVFGRKFTSPGLKGLVHSVRLKKVHFKRLDQKPASFAHQRVDLSLSLSFSLS